MTGRIHSFQSLGAVDGPGLRGVVFMQGCPLRCSYCHNPDTWNILGGQETTADALLTRTMRLKHYYKNGGITVSGGEPLMQSAFVGELFQLLHAQNMHTALDTAGVLLNDDVIALLGHTDLVLCDIKFPTDDMYLRHTGHSLAPVLDFLDEVQRQRIPLWLRHVVVPDLTDTPESIQGIADIALQYNNLEYVELLGFKNICQMKYDTLGIPFPLAATPPATKETLQKMHNVLRSRGINTK